MMDLTPTAKNDFDMSSEVVEAFTQGDCWALATEVARVSGWTMVTLSATDDKEAWCHVAVWTPDGHILDIQGVWNPDEWANYWEYSLGGQDCDFADWTHAEFKEHSDREGMYLQWDEIVEEWAKKLLAAYTLVV